MTPRVTCRDIVREIALDHCGYVTTRDAVEAGVPAVELPKLAAFVELTQVRDDARTTLYEGLESQSVAAAILECRERIEAEHLLDAAKQARAEGLLKTSEWQQVRKGFDCKIPCHCDERALIGAAHPQSRG